MDRLRPKRPRLKLDAKTYKSFVARCWLETAGGARVAGLREICRCIICGLEASWGMMLCRI